MGRKKSAGAAPRLGGRDDQRRELIAAIRPPSASCRRSLTAPSRTSPPVPAAGMSTAIIAAMGDLAAAIRNTRCEPPLVDR
jgi:hypothetical protein